MPDYIVESGQSSANNEKTAPIKHFFEKKKERKQHVYEMETMFVYHLHYYLC